MRGVVELTAVIGYYTMVSMTLNAHEIPLPDGEETPAAVPARGRRCRVAWHARAGGDRHDRAGLADIERFRVAVADDIATVLMTAPPVNAQDRRFREEQARIFDVLSDAPDVRAVVLTGDGRAFSAGADLRERPNLAGEAGAYPRHNRRSGRASTRSWNAPSRSSRPSTARPSAPAACWRCAATSCWRPRSAFLSMTEVDVGLAGGVRHVLRYFGQSDARLMIYTARRITGAELYRMNVVSACLPREQLMAAAMDIARDIAAKSPLAVQAAKRGFTMTEEMPLRDGYRYEQSQTVMLATTEDTKEAQRAFAEKRKPVFKD